MKKKFLGFALTLAFLIPCVIAFVGCGHTHTFDTAWKTTETHHYHQATCEHTEEKSAYGEHVYSDNADTTCNTCGYVRTVVSSNVWDGSVGQVPQEDQDGYIVITTAEELAGLAAAVNAGTDFDGKTIKLDTDIDLGGKEWTPIGYGYKKGSVVTGACFKGDFDGQDHTISNLKITGSMGGLNGEGAAGVGLFGYVHNANISNIRIDTADVTGNHYVAVVVGFTYFSKIDDCDVIKATVSCTIFNDDENGDKAGVITGYVDESDLTNCNVSYCTLSASRDAGQLIGCESNGTASDGEEDITTGNSATEVSVIWNNTGTGANINNAFVGRDA